MKKSMLTSFLVLASGCSQSSNLVTSTVSYDGSSGLSVSVIKSDRNKNTLIAGRSAVLNLTTLESVNRSGVVNWKYIIPKDVGGVKSNVQIADVSQTEEGNFLVCTNHVEPKGNPSSYSKIIELSEDGELISSQFLPNSPEKYNSNASVQKCWRSAGKLFVVRSIFGGGRYTTDVNSSAVRWVQILDSTGQIIFDKFIQSKLPSISHITSLETVGNSVYYAATNGASSEIVNLNIENGNIDFALVAGEAQLISVGHAIDVLAKEKNRVSVQRYSQNLLPGKIFVVSERNQEDVLALIDSKGDGVKIITVKLNEHQSKIYSIGIDSELTTANVEVLKSWSPPAIFSHKYARSGTRTVVLQYLQRSSTDKNKINSNLFEITVP